MRILKIILGLSFLWVKNPIEAIAILLSCFFSFFLILALILVREIFNFQIDIIVLVLFFFTIFVSIWVYLLNFNGRKPIVNFIIIRNTRNIYNFMSFIFFYIILPFGMLGLLLVGASSLIKIT